MQSIASTWESAVCSTLLKAAFVIAPSLRSWQVEPSKGRSTQSRVFEGKILPVLQWGGTGNDGEIPHQLKCLWKGSGPLALIRPILPWNVPGSTSLRPGPLWQCFFFSFLLLSSRKPLLFFISYYFIFLSLPPFWLLCMFFFLLQQTAVPAISVLDLVCSLCSLPLFLFRLHLCLLLFTTSPPSFDCGSW